MSELIKRNEPKMYQLSHPPHLYLQLNATHPTNGSDTIQAGRINHESGTSMTNYCADQFVTNSRDMRSLSAINLHNNEYQRGPSIPKKNTFWVSKRAVKNSQSNSPALSECESDDSGLSSTTSNSVYNNNNYITNNNNVQGETKKIYEPLAINRINPNPQHYQIHFGSIGSIPLSHPRISPHQQSLFFHNKRRHIMNRGIIPARGIPTVRYNNHNYHTPHYIAPDRFLLKAHLMHVKDTPLNLLIGSKWDTLSKDIWNKFLICQQTEDTFRKKMKLWRFLYIAIKDMFPRYSLYLVGSTVSGFGANTSDMDLCLLVKHVEAGDSRSQALIHLSTIYTFIQSKDVFFRADLIQAKVPILKFCDNNFFLEVDLNCNNIVGIKNTHLLYCYSQLDWRVRPLVLIVKLWARFNNINDAKNRTISSYSLVLMVIHYLQCGVEPAILPCLQKDYPEKFSNNLSIYNIDLLEEMPKYKNKNNQALGELLYGFLQYYTVFNYSKYAISVREGKLLDIEECRIAHKNDPHQWKLLCVEEPFDLSNTARSVYDPDVFVHIRNVFESSRRLLEKSPLLMTILPTYKMH